MKVTVTRECNMVIKISSGIEFLKSDKKHIGRILSFYFSKHEKVAGTNEKIPNVYGNQIVSKSKYQSQFERFLSRNVGLKNKAGLERPEEIDEDLLKANIKMNPTVTMRELGLKLNVKFTLFEKYGKCS